MRGAGQDDHGDLDQHAEDERRAHGGPDRPRLGEVPRVDGVEAREERQVWTNLQLLLPQAISQ